MDWDTAVAPPKSRSRPQGRAPPRTTPARQMLSQLQAPATPRGSQPVMELRRGELNSPALQEALESVRVQCPAGLLTVGTHRYAFHLPSLRGAHA